MESSGEEERQWWGWILGETGGKASAEMLGGGYGYIYDCIHMCTIHIIGYIILSISYKYSLCNKYLIVYVIYTIYCI